MWLNWIEEDVNESDNQKSIEILSILNHWYRGQDYVIGALAWRSWLHVRPSVVLYWFIRKLWWNFNVLLRENNTSEETIIDSPMDIASLWYTWGKEFEIVLRGDHLSDWKIQDFVNEVESLERKEVAWCESIPSALQRILGGNF